MNIVEAVKTGFPPEQLAQDFMDELLGNSGDTSAIFIQGGLGLLLDLPIEITEQNLGQQQVDYSGNCLRHTNFDPESKEVVAYFKFLEHIFVLLPERQEESESEDEPPIEKVTYLIVSWLRECWRLLRTDTNCVEESKCKEALAYINMHLLGLLHTTRVTYAHAFPGLHTLCNLLLMTAADGILYEHSHRFIVEATCRALNGDDFVWFVEYKQGILTLFRNALTVENKPETHKLIFNHLKLLIDQHNDRPKILSFITEFLTTAEILKIFSKDLLEQRERKHLIPLLNLLNTLQRHLDSLECFSDDFMDAFLKALFNENCPELAAAVYVSMMQKKGGSDKILVQRIVNHYLGIEPNIINHPGYVQKISRNFAYLRNELAMWFMHITANNPDSSGSVFAAQFLLEVYKDMLQSIDDNIYGIMNLLQSLPAILFAFHYMPAMGVLLEVVEVTDYSALKKSSLMFDHIINNLGIYFYNSFTQLDKPGSMEYPLLQNLYAKLLKVVDHTGNIEMIQTVSEQIVLEYYKLERTMQVCDALEQLAQPAFLDAYCDVLKKLNIILTRDVLSTEQMVNVLRTLKERYFHNRHSISLAQNNFIFFDLYCIEVLTMCAIGISRQPSITHGERSLIKETVLLLECYLSQQLENAAEVLKQPFVAVKTVYNSFINLLIAFPFRNHIISLPLQADIYEVLTTVLLALDVNAPQVFSKVNEPTRIAPQRSLEYKKEMFEWYIELHNRKAIWLPTNDVWKVVAQYRRPLQAFDAELEKLITTLVLRHPSTYMHIMPMVTYTLHNAHPEAIFVPILKAHKRLLEKKTTRISSSDVKLNIVITVLDMAKRQTEILPPVTNRLTILKSLSILINTSEWKKVEHQQVIASASKLRDRQLSSVEESFLQTFIEFIDKQKSMVVAVIPAKNYA